MVTPINCFVPAFGQLGRYPIRLPQKSCVLELETPKMRFLSVIQVYWYVHDDFKVWHEARDSANKLSSDLPNFDSVSSDQLSPTTIWPNAKNNLEHTQARYLKLKKKNYNNVN